MPEPEFPPATILVVEDEEDVRELARDVLEMNGHRVLEALDVADAVRLAQSHPGPIDLLITDVMMPGATGPELAGRVRAHRPGLRVLCMSGYPESTDRRIGRPGRLERVAAEALHARRADAEGARLPHQLSVPVPK
jgi:CheY-like chemotaxis protein